MDAEAIFKAGLSGATGGAAAGLGGSFLSGASPKTALRNALIAALASGAVSGGGVGIGSALLGDPDNDEPNPYTRRAALGSSIAGGIGGGALGALLSKKYLQAPKAMSKAASFFTGKHPGISALLGASGGALMGAYQGSGEGMQLDVMENELDDLRRRRRRE